MIRTSQGQCGRLDSCDEFAEQIRLCAEEPFLLLGYFDSDTREFTSSSFAKDPQFPAQRCSEVIAAAGRRLAIFAASAGSNGATGNAASQAAPSQGAPVWIDDPCCLLGIAQPIAGTYPVVGLPCPTHPGRTMDPKLIRLCFTYMAQSLARSVYASPTWPHALVETTLRVLSIEFFLVAADGDVLVDGRTREGTDTGGWLILNNRLSLPDERERAALREAIRDAALPPHKASIVSMTTEPGKVRLSAVAPVQSLDERLALVLFERRNTDHFALREHFFRAYGLTKSEGRIAHEVLDGKSIGDAAALTNFSLETARSYMKSVLTKTNTHRQQELISLYYSSILPIGRTIAAVENRRLNNGKLQDEKSRIALGGR